MLIGRQRSTCSIGVAQQGTAISLPADLKGLLIGRQGSTFLTGVLQQGIAISLAADMRHSSAMNCYRSCSWPAGGCARAARVNLLSKVKILIQLACKGCWYGGKGQPALLGTAISITADLKGQCGRGHRPSEAIVHVLWKECDSKGCSPSQRNAASSSARKLMNLSE